ncbi:MAG: hypothetical protein MAG795_00951 [Candidatus Woesearchaeota archaeon]|nr:hypothetical protein [Candidatus Woesearchaeota archaeon]
MVLNTFNSVKIDKKKMVTILVAGLLGYYISRQMNQIFDIAGGLDKTTYSPNQVYRRKRVRKAHKGFTSDEQNDLDSLVGTSANYSGRID